MKITFLGTGPSLGIPVISCKCEVCTSSDPRDKRLRSSILIKLEDTTLLIDAGPDFREQMLRYNPQSKLDAILITHSHRDHIGGLDEVRPFNFINNRPMPIYAEQNVIDDIKNYYAYSFSSTQHSKYSLPAFKMTPITLNPFTINNIKITPIRVYHHIPILGFKIKNFAYITDAKDIPDKEFEKLKNINTLVINALHIKPHPTHFNLREALMAIEKIKPQKAYLTHLSHKLGKHSDLLKILPENVEPAYDGLTIEI